MVKIKFVNKIPCYKGCTGAYDHRIKSILIAKWTKKEDRKEIIDHEKGHYYVDIFGICPPLKHCLNLAWDLISALIIADLGFKFGSAKHIWGYYKNARKNGGWVY